MRILLNDYGANNTIKMWEVTAHTDGITIYYGTVGKKPRTQTIPLSSCLNGSPDAEAETRAFKKKQSGYWVVHEDGPLPSKPIPETAKKKPVRSRNLADSLASLENAWF